MWTIQHLVFEQASVLSVGTGACGSVSHGSPGTKRYNSDAEIN